MKYDLKREKRYKASKSRKYSRDDYKNLKVLNVI